MHSETPQLTISRVFDAPRALVFRAFTDPDRLATWWGPSGNSLPRDEIEFDVRPGGFQRWTEVAADDPDVRVDVAIDLTDVVDGERLEGVLHVSGRLPGGFEPFETRFRRTWSTYDSSPATVGTSSGTTSWRSRPGHWRAPSATIRGLNPWPRQ